MIVDDSRVARLALARRLGARGIEVVSVASGADALRKLQDTRPDAIFMDYMMPEMDGLEACRAIVNNPKTSSIPVIMTTSNDTPEFRKRGVASGARGFLSKGLEDRELDNVLDSVVESAAEQKITGGMEMETGRVEIDEKTLSMIRDQAINAARKASEEYFTSQLPGLEEQVIQVAESAARQVAAPAGERSLTGSANIDELKVLRERIDNIYSDKQLRSIVQRVVREESGGSGGGSRAPDRREVPSRSGFGRFVRTVLILVILIAIAGAAIVYGLPDSPLAAQIQEAILQIMAVTTTST